MFTALLTCLAALSGGAVACWITTQRLRAKLRGATERAQCLEDRLTAARAGVYRFDITAPRSEYAMTPELCWGSGADRECEPGYFDYRLVLPGGENRRLRGYGPQQVDAAGNLAASHTLIIDLTQVKPTKQTTFNAARPPWEPRFDHREQSQPMRYPTAKTVLLTAGHGINRKVVCRTLEELGFHVEVVANPRAAVEAWCSGSYGLILMDCEMPALDGFKAAREIRALEQRGSRERTPIVGLAPLATKSSNEQWTAAGLDACLSKPVDPVQLEVCVEPILGADPSLSETIVMSEGEFVLPGPPMDWDCLVATRRGDANLAREVAVGFMQNGFASLRRMLDALAAGDHLALGDEAKALKADCANLRATAASTAAARLEVAAHEGDAPRLTELLGVLNDEVQIVIHYLRSKMD